MKLADLPIGQVVSVRRVGGERAFRRRLMELGLVPGARVELVSIAPLGDPVELLVRGCSLSIRRAEARSVEVSSGRPDVVAAKPAEHIPHVPAVPSAVGLGCSSCARGTP